MDATETPAGSTAIRVGGAWLAVASFLMIAALGLHGPIPPELGDRIALTRVAGAHQDAGRLPRQKGTPSQPGSTTRSK